MAELQGERLATTVAGGGGNGAQPAERLSEPQRVAAALAARGAGGRPQQGQQGPALPPLPGVLRLHPHEPLQQVLPPACGKLRVPSIPFTFLSRSYQRAIAYANRPKAQSEMPQTMFPARHALWGG